MGRRGDGGAYLDLLARIRGALPGVSIRSTFIAGLLGETEEEFEDALAFVGEAGLGAAPSRHPTSTVAPWSAALLYGGDSSCTALP